MDPRVRNENKIEPHDLINPRPISTKIFWGHFAIKSNLMIDIKYGGLF